MKVVMHIEKVHFYVIAGLLVLFGGMFAVNAFGGVSPSVMGHSAGEVDLSPISISGNNVGIGTISPTQKLDVIGNAKISSKVMASQYCDVAGNDCTAAANLGGGANTNAITLCPNNQFLDGDGSCLTATQITAQGGGWQQGMWCGNGFHAWDANGGDSSDYTATDTVLCKGYNPAINCPSGFARKSYSMDQVSDGSLARFYTCTKK